MSKLRGTLFIIHIYKTFATKPPITKLVTRNDSDLLIEPDFPLIECFRQHFISLDTRPYFTDAGRA